MDKKKFLTELGKLLTFMYDEDRATALSMYLEMFEQTSDEEALLRLLSSPTRQAVLLARNYNARERDLSVRGTSGEGDADVQSESDPAFVRAIGTVSAKAEEAGLFSSYVSVWTDRNTSAADNEEEHGFEEASHSEGFETAPEYEAVPETAGTQDKGKPAEDTDGSMETTAEDSSSPEGSPAAGKSPVPEGSPVSGITENGPVSGEHPELQNDLSGGSLPSGKSVDRLLEDFMADSSDQKKPSSAIDPGKFVMDTPDEQPYSPDSVQENGNTKSENSEETGENEPRKSPFFMEDSTADNSRSEARVLKRHRDSKEKNEENKADRQKTKVARSEAEPDAGVKETNMFLLVLYIILAVPVTAVLLILILIPAVAALAISILLIVFGFKIISTAFSGFSVFADIMVVLGAAFVLIAVGLMAFWVFIWFVGKVMVNLINEAIVLGERFSTMGGD